RFGADRPGLRADVEGLEDVLSDGDLLGRRRDEERVRLLVDGDLDALEAVAAHGAAIAPAAAAAEVTRREPAAPAAAAAPAESTPAKARTEAGDGRRGFHRRRRVLQEDAERVGRLQRRDELARVGERVAPLGVHLVDLGDDVPDAPGLVRDNQV